MYCKNCGNQVEDDANFCKHCGACLNFNYDDEKPAPKGESGPGLLERYEKLSPEGKKWFWAYVIWLTIHLTLLASGDSDCNEYGFFPWHEVWGKWELEWELKVYGLPEFLVYTVLIPVIIFVISRIARNTTKETAPDIQPPKIETDKEKDPPKPVSKQKIEYTYFEKAMIVFCYCLIAFGTIAMILLAIFE